MVLEELKKYDEAEKELKKIISLDPKNINAFLGLGSMHMKKNSYSDAAKTYEELLEFEKTKPEIYIYLGNAYLQDKNYTGAEQALSEGLRLFSDNDELNFNLAILYEKTGRFEDMISQLKRTIGINPKHADALNYLGYSYVEKGINLQEAQSLIQGALELKPNNGYIIDSLGWLYFKLGKYEDAVKTLQRALDIVKEDPVIFEHLGDAYDKLGDSGNALRMWNEALKSGEKEEGLIDRVKRKINELTPKTQN